LNERGGDRPATPRGEREAAQAARDASVLTAEMKAETLIGFDMTSFMPAAR
jgi:hypothetical protein